MYRARKDGSVDSIRVLFLGFGCAEGGRRALSPSLLRILATRSSSSASSNGYANGGGAGTREDRREEPANSGGLSRVMRAEGGRELRGRLRWPWYERWRIREGQTHTHQSHSPPASPPILAAILATLSLRFV
ncbi:hypothetical protein MSAN_01124200 [Mycena sanguinolenta]|uniref:Uncharacterized protein n=1 Tax=Mycena sanguinolenta TaxID=230812 RepID=A0A8H7D6R7_9AGAR|nr:hypothetical protein MSAN_01124200 [Mycena sanguinolenta]